MPYFLGGICISLDFVLTSCPDPQLCNVMRLWGDGEVFVGFRANSQQRILEDVFGVQKGDFIKVGGQDSWADRTAPDPVERLVIYLGVGGDKVEGMFPMRLSYAKEQLTGYWRPSYWQA